MKKVSILLILGLLSSVQNGYCQTQVSGSITTNTTWASGGSYILTGALTIRNSAILTIESNVTVNQASYNIIVGSSTPGTLNATGAAFMSPQTTDRKILFQDGGTGTINQCAFDDVFIELDPDAGTTISITNNSFTNVNYPVNCDINRFPVFTGNTGNPEIIGLGGTATTSLTLPVMEWSYALSTNLTIRNNAVLTLPPGINIDLKSSTISVGSSSAGELVADGVRFTSSSGSDKHIGLLDGGKATITSCSFDNVFIDIDSDAGTPVTLNGNSFESAQYPVKANAVNIPVMSGNMADQPWIGLKGNVTASTLLPLMEWNYALTEAMTIRDQSVLTLAQGVRLILNGKYLYIGSSATNTGTLQADGATFFESPDKNGRMWLREGSAMNLANCLLEGTRVQLEGGAPAISHSRLTRSRTAIYVNSVVNPDIQNNDFYHNDIAVDHRGNESLALPNNWWGHSSGPTHATNPAGVGESISGTGTVSFTPVLQHPVTGNIEPQLDPAVIDMGYLMTGVKKDSAFMIRNVGDIELLVTAIGTSSSLISVDATDGFWILPDSSVRIPFSFTTLQFGAQSDTIMLSTNGPGTGNLRLPVTAEGRVDDITLNFYHIEVDSFPVVKCHFSVTDQSFLPIRTLAKENITLSEQHIGITDFELIGRTASRAVKVALVMDRSGSMSGIPLRDAKNAANDFIRELSPMDQAALVSFASTATVNAAFTSDQSALITAVNALKAEGSTALFNAIDMSISMVRDLPGIRAILALSDGQDNASSKTAADVINTANQAGINIYTIGLGRDADPSLETMARQTGGQYFYSPTSKDLATIYRMISGQLQNLYVVRYTASETLPFPRRVELGVNVYGLSDSAVRYYGMGNTEVEFSFTGPPFRRQEFAADSKGYFYYFINPDSVELSEGMTFTYFMNSNDHTVPCGGEYMGDGIMQFWADFRGITETGDYPVTLPDSVSQSGGWILFNPKPQPFTASLVDRKVTQSIDIFAGGSAGVKALAGALGAGPSIAAASVTASGTGGMGINFERNSAGDEWITRRLEAGVAVKAEAPEINTVIDAVQVGLSAEVATKGTVGQTMAFPSNPADPGLITKAKAAYLLETLSYGGMVVSPYFGIVLQAVQEALVALNPDVSAIYNTLYDSWNLGVSTEGKIGAEFKLAPSEGSGLPEFTFAEASASMGMSGSFTHYVQNNDLALGLGFATAFDLGLINLEVGNVKLGSLFKYKHGAEVSLDSDFNLTDGLTNFNLGFLSYNYGSLTFLQGYYGHLYSVNVPEPVIERATAVAGNLIRDVSTVFQPGSSVPQLRIGTSYFADALDAIFGFDEDSLGSYDDHIVLSTEEQFSKGINADIKISLDAALGVGLGLEFGIAFSYLDKLRTPTEEYVLAQGKILPIAEYPGVTDQDNLFSVQTEMSDLFSGVIGLVTDGLLNLVDLTEFVIDAGIDFITDLPDNAGQLLGSLEEGGTAILREVDPRNWLVREQPFRDTEVIHAYWSPRVVKNWPGPSTKSGTDPESDLYVISKAYNITIVDATDQILPDFTPLQLKIAINSDMLGDLGFGEEEKSMARLYWYNPDNMSWTLLGNDLITHPDTVGAEITRSGTYAIGLEIVPSHDKTAPGIIENYPPEGGSIAPQALIWAKLLEAPTGVGIDLIQTSLKIDGVVMDAAWDPVNSVVSYSSPVPLTLGGHTYTVTVADYLGNTSTKTVSFNVVASNTSPILNNTSPSLLLYPNPARDILTIEVNPARQTLMEIDVYDAMGKQIFSLMKGSVLPGIHRYTWNRRTDTGATVIPGIYFIRVKEGDTLTVRRLVLAE